MNAKSAAHNSAAHPDGTRNRPGHDAGVWFRGFERRAHRRHDLLSREVTVQAVPAVKDRAKKAAPKPQSLGHLIDLSAGGIRLRTEKAVAKSFKLNAQIQVRVELPSFAGISPFIVRSGPHIRPKREWTGTMTVVRIAQVGEDYEIGGRLDDIDELDQGMLSLYLSTQPLAA